MRLDTAIDDIASAQQTLTENARCLARIVLRESDPDLAQILAAIRDTTADAVKRLEKARLTVRYNLSDRSAP